MEPAAARTHWLARQLVGLMHLCVCVDREEVDQRCRQGRCCYSTWAATHASLMKRASRLADCDSSMETISVHHLHLDGACHLQVPGGCIYTSVKAHNGVAAIHLRRAAEAALDVACRAGHSCCTFLLRPRTSTQQGKSGGCPREHGQHHHTALHTTCIICPVMNAAA